MGLLLNRQLTIQSLKFSLNFVPLKTYTSLVLKFCLIYLISLILYQLLPSRHNKEQIQTPLNSMHLVLESSITYFANFTITTLAGLFKLPEEQHTVHFMGLLESNILQLPTLPAAKHLVPPCRGSFECEALYLLNHLDTWA